MSWGQLAELYLRAKVAARKGDYTQLQQFYQKRLALPWNEFHEDFHIETIPGDYLMGEYWENEGNIGGVPLRFLSVDVQRECFYAVVRAWGLDGSSRLMHCEKLHSWDDISTLAERFGVQRNLCSLTVVIRAMKCMGIVQRKAGLPLWGISELRLHIAKKMASRWNASTPRSAG